MSYNFWVSEVEKQGGHRVIVKCGWRLYSSKGLFGVEDPVPIWLMFTVMVAESLGVSTTDLPEGLLVVHDMEHWHWPDEEIQKLAKQKPFLLTSFESQTSSFP